MHLSEFSKILRTLFPLKFVALTLFFLIVILVFGEIVTRSEIFQIYTPFPSTGSGNVEIDMKFALLNKFVQEKGRVDCIFIGTSSTEFSIDPQIFNRSYKNILGEEPACFNFGIRGLRISSGRKLAQFLDREYHPNLIIFGVNHIEFYVTGFGSDYVPWLDYQLGSPSLDGWLLGNFYTFRYLRTLRVYSNAETRGAMGLVTITALGFHPDHRVSSPPPLSSSTQPYFPDYHITSEEINEFSQLLQVRSLLLFEEPTHPLYLPFLIKGNEDGYENDYISPLINKSSESGVRFWRTRDMFTKIPLSGWGDFMHSNEEGAYLFSEWLGTKVALSILNKDLQPLSTYPKTWK